MLPFLTKMKESETSEKFLTLPVIILLLLMMAFVGSGVYIVISTFLS